ncbi:MAG: hypothetical protein KGZ92_02580 [Firmicutes bacterium]|nr:hypothetical protein [Dethiobacter sp.]MBS3888173.1 hypothetical protein [Bacillota bacterium]
MYWQRILAGLLALSCLFAPLGFAEANTHRSRIWAAHPANVDLLYDYVEMIANTEPITTRVLSSETFTVPITLDGLLEKNDTHAPLSGRLIYGMRILETTIPGSAIYWGRWNGEYQLIKNSAIWVAQLAIQTTVHNYLFSVFMGFSPQPTSTVGIEIGYSHNTYLKTVQIQSSLGGNWETYYTAYRYDYFRYDRATVANPQGINPPLLQYVDNPTTIPDRIAPSPNFYNDGELSHRAFLLHQNYCPAGWETENQTYYPLTYSRYGIQAT